MLQNYSNYYHSSSTFHGSIAKVMWTRFDMVLTDIEKNTAETLWQKTVIALEYLNKLLNRFDSNSEIFNINSNAGSGFVYVSKEVWDILKDCKEYNEKTDGLFDITLKNFSSIHFNDSNQSIFFDDKETSLDLGAYGKGYALKTIQKILKEGNVINGLINFGNSSILAIGSHPHGNTWNVHIENPFSPKEILGEIKLSNTSLSTSGNMPSHTNHIFDVRKQKYIQQKKVVSVVAPDPVVAEVLSTTFIIAEEPDRKLIEQKFRIDKTLIYH